MLPEIIPIHAKFRLRWDDLTWVNGRNSVLLVARGKTAWAVAKWDCSSGSWLFRADRNLQVPSRGGGDVNKKNQYGNAPLLVATHGDIQCVPAMREYGAQVAVRDALGETPLVLISHWDRITARR
jgi:hypothetical protein